MQENFNRSDGRRHDQLRQVRIVPDAYGYACSSILLELGNTKVLCAVTLQKTVPPFLKGKKTGWLNAEYAMLPAATQVRSARGATTLKPIGRSMEISRLLGRSLRAMVNMSVLEERTITVDCDVLQADGGTRTACLTAASLALQIADYRWQQEGIISQSVIVDTLVGVSIGVIGENVLLDLAYTEDSMVDADVNFIINSAGKVIEIQGTAEHAPLGWDNLDRCYRLACEGALELRAACERVKQDSMVMAVSTQLHIGCSSSRCEEI